MGREEHERAVRFRTARRDPELTVVEGFHALKHALRFGAELVEVSADGRLGDFMARLAQGRDELVLTGQAMSSKQGGQGRQALVAGTGHAVLMHELA